MRLLRRALLASLPVLVAVSCISPTLPMPPPAPPETIEQIGQGQYRLTGVIPFSGTVLVLDQRTALVYGKVVDDVYSLDVAAAPLDRMVLWYESGQDVSDVVEFEIPAADGPAPGPDGGQSGSADASVTDAGSG